MYPVLVAEIYLTLPDYRCVMEFVHNVSKSYTQRHQKVSDRTNKLPDFTSADRPDRQY